VGSGSADGGILLSDQLWLQKEPTAQEVIELLQKKDLTAFKEVVFCGYGEPTYRLAEIIEIAKYLDCRASLAMTKKTPVRLDTNGHGSFLNGRDIAPELEGLIDKVSISLNASTAERYDSICKPLIPGAYGEMLDFAKSCITAGIDTQFSVVDVLPADEIEKCRDIALKLGAGFRVREYIN